MKLPVRFSEPKTPLFWIALLRMMIGLVFLTTWVNNLREGLYTPEGLLRFFTEVFPQAENPLPFYAAFIDGVILPVRSAFAPFQLVAELLLGLALLVGFLTPFFSLAGIFFLTNTLLATAGQDWFWAYLMPIGILVVVLLARAGRAAGLDSRLVRRYPWLERWWV
ncbi:MAG: DoxX family membrane protein [Chloroflexi bacterium]|nr:MAG: DoxX family membrane protein [Chloroflexota bacterium]